MKPVAAGDEITRDLARLAVMTETHDRRTGVESMKADARGVKHDAATGIQPRLHQILDDFMLGINTNTARPPVRPSKSHAMPATVAAQPLDAAMAQPSRCSRSPTPVRPKDRRQHSCSNTPARTRSSICCWLCASRTIDSMPSRCNRCDSMSPAGPAPTIATCVRIIRRSLWRLHGLFHDLFHDVKGRIRQLVTQDNAYTAACSRTSFKSQISRPAARAARTCRRNSSQRPSDAVIASVRRRLAWISTTPAAPKI